MADRVNCLHLIQVNFRVKGKQEGKQRKCFQAEPWTTACQGKKPYSRFSERAAAIASFRLVTFSLR